VFSGVQQSWIGGFSWWCLVGDFSVEVADRIPRFGESKRFEDQKLEDWKLPGINPRIGIFLERHKATFTLLFQRRTSPTQQIFFNATKSPSNSPQPPGHKQKPVWQHSAKARYKFSRFSPLRHLFLHRWLIAIQNSLWFSTFPLY
jgi:hypothetical protein